MRVRVRTRDRRRTLRFEAPILLALLMLGLSAGPTSAHLHTLPLGSEVDFQHNQRYAPNVAVVPAWLYKDPTTITRQDYLANLWRWEREGWTRDHINYGELTTIDTLPGDPRDLAYRDPDVNDDHSLDYRWDQPLSAIFLPHVALNVLKIDDQHFIMSSCGNHTETPGTVTLPTITGQKFEDYDADGTRDPGEPGLSGWTIRLNHDGVEVAHKTTDSTGKYSFSMSGLDPGTYVLREDLKPGWVQSCQPRAVTIPAGPGREHGGNDFGNYVPSSISGHKFEDVDQDGTWDAGEPARADWTIRLTGEGISLFTSTDATGAYAFESLKPGTYNLSEDLVAPWRATLTPAAIVIPAVRGRDHPTNDFGNFYPGIIRGVKWDDSNADGVRQEIEAPLASWGIVLVSSGEEVARTTTAVDGSYVFEGLDAGEYEVWEVLSAEAAWRQTHPSAGTAEPAIETVALGHHGPISIRSHSLIEGRDFGNVALGTVVKSVVHYWWREPLEASVTLSEVDVSGLLANEPSLPMAIPTDAGGETVFDRLLPGRYLVKVAVPTGWYAEPADGDWEEVVVPEGQTVERTNSLYDGRGSEPRTLGFWKNWRLKYSSAEMLALIVRVQRATESFSGLTLDGLDAILKVSDKKSQAPEIMAESQYLALWLNLASERLGFTTEVDLSSVPSWESVVEDADGFLSLHELMLQLRAQYTSGTLSAGEWEALKDVCDYINNSWVTLMPPVVPPPAAQPDHMHALGSDLTEGADVELMADTQNQETLHIVVHDQFGNEFPDCRVTFELLDQGRIIVGGGGAGSTYVPYAHFVDGSILHDHSSGTPAAGILDQNAAVDANPLYEGPASTGSGTADGDSARGFTRSADTAEAFDVASGAVVTLQRDTSLAEMQATGAGTFVTRLIVAVASSADPGAVPLWHFTVVVRWIVPLS